MSPEALKNSLLHNHLKGQEHPKTLDEAIVAIDKMLNDQTKTFIRSIYKDDAISMIDNIIGRYIHNKWALGKDSDLARHLKVLGIEGPNEMSHAIIEAYCNSCE
jgi:hypothetical protein